MERSEEIRKMLGISRAAFSRKYNIPIRTLEDWDAGKKNPPEYVMDLLERAVRDDKKTKEDGNMKNYKNYDRVETEIKYDKRFILDEEGNEELCHHTGYDVYIDGTWWGEYEDSEGGLHYGN